MCSHPIIEYLDKHGYIVVVGSRTPNAAKLQGAPKAQAEQIDVETVEG